MAHGIKRDKYGVGNEENEFIPPTHILIEMDGALVNSSTALYQAYEGLLKSFDISPDKNEFKKTIGLSNEEYLLALSDFYGLKGSLTKLQTSYLKLIKDAFKSATLFPGAQKFLAQAHSLGLSVALIAALPAAVVTPFLSDNEIADFFDLVVTSESYKTPSDQYLNPFHYALVTLGANPLEAVSVTNSNIAVEESLDIDIITFLLTQKSQDPATALTKEKSCVQVRDWEALRQVFDQKFGLTL